MNPEYRYWCELGLDGGVFTVDVSFDHEATQAEIESAAIEELQQECERAKLREWGRA